MSQKKINEADLNPKKVIIAVFDVDNGPDTNLDNAMIEKLSAYTVKKLEKSGYYQVIPRGQLRKMTQNKKCDDSCKRATGRQIGAQVSLSTRITRKGNKCQVNMGVIGGNASGINEGGSSGSGGCSEIGIQKSLHEALWGAFGAARNYNLKQQSR